MTDSNLQHIPANAVQCVNNSLMLYFCHFFFFQHILYMWWSLSVHVNSNGYSGWLYGRYSGLNESILTKDLSNVHAASKLLTSSALCDVNYVAENAWVDYAVFTELLTYNGIVTVFFSTFCCRFSCSIICVLRSL